VSSYKEKFDWKLWDKIEKIAKKDPEKLRIIIQKIDAIIKKFDENTKLSEEDKDKIFSQLEALKELVKDNLDSKTDITE
jgi:hypothetical protein